jgi:hypothetical protein
MRFQVGKRTIGSTLPSQVPTIPHRLRCNRKRATGSAEGLLIWPMRFASTGGGSGSHFLRRPAPYAFMRCHHVVSDFHYRVAQSRTDHGVLRDDLTSQTNHGQFDWFDRRPVQLKAQVMFPHLPTKIAVAGSNSELASRSLFPCAPGDGAVRAFKCFPG